MVVDLIKYRIWNYDHFDRKGSKNIAIRNLCILTTTNISRGGIEGVKLIFRSQLKK